MIADGARERCAVRGAGVRRPAAGGGRGGDTDGRGVRPSCLVRRSGRPRVPSCAPHAPVGHGLRTPRRFAYASGAGRASRCGGMVSGRMGTPRAPHRSGSCSAVPRSRAGPAPGRRKTGLRRARPSGPHPPAARPDARRTRCIAADGAACRAAPGRPAPRPRGTTGPPCHGVPGPWVTAGPPATSGGQRAMRGGVRGTGRRRGPVAARDAKQVPCQGSWAPHPYLRTMHDDRVA